MQAGRGIKKTNAARKLDELGVRYELISFETDADDLSAERAADDLGLPREIVYKTLVASGDRTGVIKACIPSNMEINMKALALLSGNKSVSMVPLRELTPLTGYVRGGCSPIGSKKTYPVFIFEDALAHERIAVNAGSRGLLFLISPRDLVRAVGAVTGNIAHP